MEGREGAPVPVQTVGGDAAPLLVGSVENVESWVEAEVPGPFRDVGDAPVRRVRSQFSGGFIELELENGVGAGSGTLGDVRRESIGVGRVGLDVMGSDPRLPPLDGTHIQRAVGAERMDPDPGLVVVGGQQVAARAVNGYVGRVSFQGDVIDGIEPPCPRLDGEGRQPELSGLAPSGEEEAAGWIGSQGRGHPGQGRLRLFVQLPGFRVYGVLVDAVVLLQGNVQVPRH